ALKRRLEVADFLGGKTSTRRESHTRNDSRGRYNSNDRRGRNDSYQRNDRNDSRGRHDRNDSFGRNDRRGRNDSYQRNDRNDSFGRNDRRGNNFGRNDRFDNRRSYDKPYERKEVVVEKTPKPILALEKDFEKIKGKLKARFYDAKKKKIKDVKVKEMIEAMEKSRKKIDTVVFDGIITKRLLESAEEKGIKNIVGVRKSSASSTKVKTYTM
ncbi:MAG: hypothetical protein HON47_01835, partial [Candidatus Diapherotrites archaeon]|nr:hypothetical protein [Candidatus Diapherotrites archaeon]